MTNRSTMTDRRLSRRLVLRAAVLSAGAVALAGCESLQDIPAMFERRQPPLPGNRQSVFPEGVPGIDRSIPQPANAPSAAPPAPAPEETQQPPQRQRR